jgi:hypothetical protein
MAAVVRAPALVLAIYVITMLSAVPFALVLGARVNAALGEQQVASEGAAQIDAEWWREYRLHATGLAATFTPAIIGVAAPLDALSGLLDGERPPLAMFGPVALYAVLWAFLWGGVLERFLQRRALGVRDFIAAGARSFVSFLALSAIALAIYAVLYVTVHRVLFGPVFAWLAAAGGSERAAFVWRVVLYAVFLALLFAVAIVIDFARVAIAAGDRITVVDATRSALALVRARAGAITGVYLTSAVCFAGLLALYGATEIYGGARVGGWRAVALGQAYIGGRLALRLILAAATVAIFSEVRRPVR